jgi:murein DD-endopeptidase MepM/ murein hydrolase activator NlpD
VNAGTISPVSTPPRDLADAKDRVFLRFNADDAAGLFDLYSESMKAAVPAEKTSSFLRSVLSAKGRWLSSDALSTDPLHGVWRVHAERGDWTLEIHVAPKGLITGLRVTDAAEPSVTQSTIVLGLPFRGEWLVHWGGDRSDVNHHVGARDQRRAADLVIVDGDGKTHRGEGKSNADYLAYGQDVLAVADGTVVTVVDGVPENEPGAMNRYVVPGNFVILGHMPNLFSMYAHLQPGSIAWLVGRRSPAGRSSASAATAEIQASRTCTSNSRMAPPWRKAGAWRRSSTASLSDATEQLERPTGIPSSEAIAFARVRDVMGHAMDGSIGRAENVVTSERSHRHTSHDCHSWRPRATMRRVASAPLAPHLFGEHAM